MIVSVVDKDVKRLYKAVTLSIGLIKNKKVLIQDLTIIAY